jgi:hypothetical protein
VSKSIEDNIASLDLRGPQRLLPCPLPDCLEGQEHFPIDWEYRKPLPPLRRHARPYCPSCGFDDTFQLNNRQARRTEFQCLEPTCYSRWYIHR